MSSPSSTDQPDFSLVRGGPWYRLQTRLHLCTPDSLRAGRRAALYVLVAWLPLAILSMIQGSAFDLSDRIPFFRDVAVQARFLIALPALVLADSMIDRGTGLTAGHLRSSGLVAPEGIAAYDEAVRYALRLRDSWLVALAIVVLSIASGWSRISQGAHEFNVWFEQGAGAQATLAPAGWWLGLVASPLFASMFLRNIWRFALWVGFLRRLSRTPLALTPAHPDRMGGLGIIQIGHRSFAALFFAVGTVCAAVVANRVVNYNAQVLDFKMVLAALLVLAVLVYIAPLFLFTPKLAVCKWRGMLEYGRLGTRYTVGFDRKWVEGQAAPGETLLGTSDIQSLADLGNASDRVDSMRVVPMDVKSAMVPILAVGLPMVPLALMVMPLKDLLRLLASAVL
jgi:hypothetical protein